MVHNITIIDRTVYCKTPNVHSLRFESTILASLHHPKLQQQPHTESGRKDNTLLFKQINNKTFEVHSLHINTFHTIYNESGKLKRMER